MNYKMTTQKKSSAKSSISGEKITQPRWSNIGKCFKSRSDELVFKDSVKFISNLIQIDTKFVLDKSRVRDKVIARHALAYYLRTHTQFTLEYIGQMMNKDHSSIIHSIRMIEDTAPFDIYLGTIKESIDKKAIPNHFSLRELILNALKTYSTPNTRTEAILNIIANYEKEST